MLTYESYFVLKNKENGKMYLLKTINQKVEQLELVDGEYNCANCGMYTRILALGLKNGVYDIYILYKNDGENILTNTGIVVEI